MKHKLQTSVASIQFLSSGLSDRIKIFNPKKKGINLIVLLAIFLFSFGKGHAQLTENFDAGIPAEWTLFGNGVGTQTWQTTTDGYLGTNGTSVDPSLDNIGDQNTAQYFLVTPQFAVPENGEIHFFTKQGSEMDNGSQYEIRISTAAQPDINGFNIVLQSYTESDLNTGSQTDYEKRIVEIPTSIPTGLDIYIAFVVTNTQNGASPTGDEWFVDNVSILEGCREIEDGDVNIENITVDGAEVSWSHPNATEFELQVLPAGGTPAGSGIPVSATTFTLTNLDEQTEYDIYIRAICDNNTISEYSGPYTFETLKLGLSCDQPIIIPDISTEPFVFTDNLDQWSNPDITYSTQGANCLSGSSSTNHLNGNKIFFTYTPTEDGLLTLTQETGVDGGANGNNCFNDSSSLFVYENCADVGVSCVAGTITTNAFEPETISNLLVQAGQTYVIVVSSQLTPSAGICFELEISNPTCAPPGDIFYNDLTENSASFNWDNIGGFSDSWEYIAVPTNTGTPTGSGTATATNLDNAVNGLSPDTTYDLYVRSVCDGTPGIWSDPVTFTTQCTVFDTPYSTDFANATNQNPEPCWITIDANGDGNSWAFIGGYATLQTKVNNVNGVNNDIYASPRVNFDGVTQKRLRYKHRATQGVSTYSVKLSTTGVGIDNFTTILLPETTINNTNFQEIIVDIPETIVGDVNIAFVVEPNTSETALRFSIDDVFIEDKPSCPVPTNLNVLNIETDSAWLTWTPGDEETQWQVAIQDEGSGVPTEDGILVDNNFPYIATDLEPGTRYEYYVRAYCDTDDQSEWVGPLAFTTLCESYDTPFFESFNDEDENTQKFCWEINDANNDDSTWTIGEERAFLQTAPFSPPSEFDDWLISPAINLDGSPKQLKYKYRADFSFFAGSPRFGLEVLMSTTNTNPSSFSVISPLEVFTNPDYVEKTIIFEGTGTVYIAFRVPPEFTGSWSILSLDDVSITDAPACPNPTDLMVDSVFTNAANLSWTSGYQETNWNIAIQPADSGIPSSGEAVTATNFTASDLTSDTEYEFYVQAVCGDETSEWVGPATFTTLCSVFDSPFVETFNSDSQTEDCWTVINNNDDMESWELNTTGFSFEGDQAAVMFTGTNGQNDDWLISPTITITENQRLRYYYRVNDSFFTEDLEVLLSTNGIGLDQFTTVLYDSDNDPVIINNVEYKVKIINFPDGITGDVNIAFHVPFFPSTGPYRGQTLAIDNVVIEDAPECPEPTNIILSNITDTEVQVGWENNGDETAWEISVQPSGTPAPVGDTDPEFLYNTPTNPFTVTGLEASTMYDIYVRAVCDGGVQGEWTGPEEVTTKCSFDNLCQYTFVLTSDTDLSSTLDITQNNQVVQSLPFDGNTGDTFTVFLCSGIQYSVYFYTIGSSQPQYDNYEFDILDDQNNIVHSSGTGIPLKTTVYEGTSTCGVISCDQPTDLSINEFSEFSWTAGGSETQWEVAVQPLSNGTLPQSGTIVSTNSYIPTDSDFEDLNVATYEYFVKAICGTDDESFWSGPFEFVRNDDVSNAITVPINDGQVCNESITEISFLDATVSPQSMTCDGTNGGDVWFNFTAESPIHIIELNSFSGSLRDSNGDPIYPELTTTLYKDNGGGNLEELACSYDNVLVASYTSELVVGDNYKVRVTLNSTEATEYRFSICIKTPQDLCLVDTVNGGFEEPVIEGLSGVTTIISVNTIPGWRSNLDSSNNIFYWEALNAPGFTPYEGGQCVQLLSDQGTTIDPNDPDIKGYYRDFNTSEITLMDYSFAHLARFDGNTVQLFAGPSGGPYEMVVSHLGTEQAWELVTGEYEVPNGQTETRFIFRASDGDDIGNVLDAVSFLPNNEIVTDPFTVDCDNNNAAIQANGVGTWVASDSNPGTVTFADADSNTTTISDFIQPGVYTFTWQTRYCSYDLEIIYNGVAETPEVESPVEYCLNDVAEQLTATPADALELIWYTQAVGGTGSTTAPTPDTSTVGNTSFYVAYRDSEGCEGPRAEIVVVVNESFTPELDFSYDDTCEVSDVNPTPITSGGFDTGGIFTSTTVTVEANTGEIDITSVTAGQHDITYTFDGDEENCLEAGTFTATVEFLAASTPVTGFDYGTEAFCILENVNPLPNLDAGFTAGGTFSSTSATVDANTGEVDLASATAGTHNINYTVEADAENCAEEGSFTATIQITESTTPITAFSYAEDVYCADSNSVSPNLTTGFTNGGTFSAESGLSVDATTGEINIATSNIGNYTVTYTVSENETNCVENGSSSFNITILDTIEITIMGECEGDDYILTASPENSSFNPDEANYTWMDVNGNVTGQNSAIFDVTAYANQNPNFSVPAQFSVTVEFGGCSVTQSFTAERSACRDIPRGISPDGNGKNDTLDLTGFGVTNITIFNRYGTEVYAFRGTYSNQWRGQSDNGDDLPDGTYFYNIEKDDGSTTTGWIYINRAY